MPPTALPIEPVLPALRDALRSRAAAVLQAPPGAGKTTRVPLALIDEPWLAGQRIVMLEPRRLAARAAAWRMASMLGERVGQTVGYRIRLDTRVGPETRIEVVTEGVLTRLLQADPALEGVRLLIFDEFHERSVHADLGLALALQTRVVLRDDLRVLVMSATLDGAAVAALLGGAPVITSEGRAHPIETRHVPRRPGARVEPAVAAVVREALAREEGDVLVFLPGAAEIRRVEALLRDAELGPGVRVAPLYGNLTQPQQDLAIAPSPPGRRKVVLSTAIAQTSLTIEGVRVVVDSGLARVPRFSPRSGMTRLETVRVSRAAADQRRGRAGRLGPGVCYRLWAEHEEQHLVPHDTPEILEADLAPLALELSAAGVTDAAALAWLDPPPAAALAQARELLAQLGAIEQPSGRITPRGRRMAELAMHPRLAHMILQAEALGLGALACDVAALLSERDVLRAEGPGGDVDLRLRLDLLRASAREGSGAISPGQSVDREAVRRVRAQAQAWREQLGLPAPARAASAADDAEACGLLLAFAYPDRIALRRLGAASVAYGSREAAGEAGGRFLLRNGRGAMLAAPQALSRASYLVAAELDDRQREGRIFLAAPIALEEIERHFGEQIERETVVAWDGTARVVRALRRERLGALVLREAPVADPDPAAVTRALLAGVAQDGLGALPWSDAARRVRQRMAFMHRLDPSWPDVSDEALLASLDRWLAPHAYGLRRREELERIDVAGALLGMLGWGQRARLDEYAPTHLTVPSGSRVPIDYADPAAPVLAVRLQEMFGLGETPRIAGGAVPLTLHLLSPAHRPVQVTRDLAGFWRSGYFDVRKDLRGRYPKHHWPDDPLRAEATRGAGRGARGATRARTED